MKFSIVRFHENDSNGYSLAVERGCSLGLDERGTGIIARYEGRKLAAWIPVSNVSSADVPEDDSSDGGARPKPAPVETAEKADSVDRKCAGNVMMLAQARSVTSLELLNGARRE